jgi:cytochrome c556
MTGARGSPKVKESLQRLIAERNRLAAQITALQNKLEGLETAIQLIGGDSTQVPPASTDTSKRGQAKTLIVNLLEEVGTAGLNATSAVELAARRGIKLERGTAASTLSRMKGDGVTYDGDKYRLSVRATPPILIVGGAKGS